MQNIAEVDFLTHYLEQAFIGRAALLLVRFANNNGKTAPSPASVYHPPRQR